MRLTGLGLPLGDSTTAGVVGGVLVPGAGPLIGAGAGALYPPQRETVPMSRYPNVPLDAAKTACQRAMGIWSDNPPACDLPTPDIPNWCGWVPFATSIFPACALPVTAQDLTAYNAKTAFITGITSGLDQETEWLDKQTAAAQGQINELMADCGYAAAANHPDMTNALGGTLASMLTDPFGQNCDSKSLPFPGWVLYAGLAVAAYFVLKGVKS